MQLNKENLIWIDLEMTGLDPKKDRIIEIATIVTDKDLNILAEGPVLAIKQSNQLLDNMDAWCTKTHTENGLIERVKNSKLTERAAELQTLDFLKKWVEKVIHQFVVIVLHRINVFYMNTCLISLTIFIIAILTLVR